METAAIATTRRAARYDRATPARTPESLPARGSRNRSIARRRRRAKCIAQKIGAVIVLTSLVVALALAVFGRTSTERPVEVKKHTASDPATTEKLAAVTGQAPAIPRPPAVIQQTEPEQLEPVTPPVRYYLTDAERDVVERVVMAESGGETYEGQMLVAQCILNGAEKTGKAPSEVVVDYKYTKARPDPTQSVRNAVAAVFDRGETVTDEPILYFYNPARVTSKWHESQIFVIEVGGHRFFAERSAE